MRTSTSRVIAVSVMALTCCGFSLSGHATAARQEQQDGDDDPVVRIDVQWLDALNSAWHAFRSREHKLSCFRVVARPDGEALIVDFVPKQVAGASVYLGGSTPCGPGMSYVMNSSGRIIRRYLSR